MVYYIKKIAGMVRHGCLFGVTMRNPELHWNHRSRMRRRFAESGLDAFDEHEALEMLLDAPIRDVIETRVRTSFSRRAAGALRMCSQPSMMSCALFTASERIRHPIFASSAMPFAALQPSFSAKCASGRRRPSAHMQQRFSAVPPAAARHGIEVFHVIVSDDGYIFI